MHHPTKRPNYSEIVRRNVERSLTAALLILFTLSLASCRTPVPRVENKNDLVDLEKIIPGLKLDIRYATTNNFTGQVLYPVAKSCLRREPAEHLKEVQEELRGMGLALKIFDGYRPLSVQKKMWAIYPHPGFVADPAGPAIREPDPLRPRSGRGLIQPG